MDPTGVRDDIEFGPLLQRCIARHEQDYARLSDTPDQFKAFSDAVGLMQKSQPDYSAQDLARIKVPTVIAHAEFDEFIKPEHAEYLARTIPHAKLMRLSGVSHFAPLQRPVMFNQALIAFLKGIF
jgi:pimeloyl-ACP methyl ester carboxylesterase